MLHDELERCWMRNKDFYLGILHEIISRMELLGISVDDLSVETGLDTKRLNHVLSGMIEDLTLLELDNMLAAVKVAPTTFTMA